jgi:hypothetical protein
VPRMHVACALVLSHDESVSSSKLGANKHHILLVLFNSITLLQTLYPEEYRAEQNMALKIKSKMGGGKGG